jgi:hypothetical protein
VSRRRELTLLACAALVLTAVVAACGSSSPKQALSAAAHPCRYAPSAYLSDAPPPSSLVAALPVLGRKHASADALPRNSNPMATLTSLATGIELHSAQLLGASPQGGHAWLIPVLHDAPPVARALACLKRTIALQERFARENPRNAQVASVVSADREQQRTDEAYVAHHPGPAQPGVIVFTTFKDAQGANATLSQIRAGEAFTTGECAGPGHNLLTLTGLAPAGTVTIRLRAPNGSTLTQPAGNGAYSFVLAPPATRPGLPNRLELLGAHGQALRTVAIAGTGFSTHPLCKIADRPRGFGFLPAGTTIIASTTHGPYGTNYAVGVSSSGGPECAPGLAIVSNQMGVGGGTRLCQLFSTSLTPRFRSGGCGPTLIDMQGSVSSAVKRIRFIAADGRTVTAPVFAAPATIAPGYGVVLAIGPTAVLSTNPKVESLGVGGRVLATATNVLKDWAHCAALYTTPPATVLAPGIAKAVTGTAPHRVPWIFSLQRVRYGGHEALCVEQTPEGGGQCFPFTPGSNPLDTNPPLSTSAPVLLTPGGAGTCTPPRYALVSGLVMRSGLSVWFKTPGGTRRVPLVAVDPRFQIPGGVFATVITRGPVTLLARNAADKTVFTAPVTNRGDKASFCGGLDGGNRPLTPAQARVDLQPQPMTHPFG